MPFINPSTPFYYLHVWFNAVLNIFNYISYCLIISALVLKYLTAVLTVLWKVLYKLIWSYYYKVANENQLYSFNWTEIKCLCFYTASFCFILHILSEPPCLWYFQLHLTFLQNPMWRLLYEKLLLLTT